MAICHNEAGPPPYVPVPGSLLCPFPIKTRYVLGRIGTFFFFCDDVLAKILKKMELTRYCCVESWLIFIFIRESAECDEGETRGGNPE